MKPKLRVVLIFLFVFVPVLGCRAQDAAAPKAAPEAQAKEEPKTWDFGTIKKDSTEERTFVFKNETGRPLTVTSINTSCGCTGSTIKDKKIRAGGSTEMVVKFNSKGYRAGAVTKYIFIVVDDPKNPVIRQAVKIEVVE